jgi:hypothetical protein
MRVYRTHVLHAAKLRISINIPNSPSAVQLSQARAAYLHLVAIFLYDERVEVSNPAATIGPCSSVAESPTLKPILRRFRNVRRIVDILDETPPGDFVRECRAMICRRRSVSSDFPFGGCVVRMWSSAVSMFVQFAWMCFRRGG